MADDDLCVSLNAALNAGDQFETIKGEQVDKDKWATTLMLPQADRCAIDKVALDGSYTYRCKFTTDADQGMNEGIAYFDGLQGCLSEWEQDVSLPSLFLRSDTRVVQVSTYATDFSVIVRIIAADSWLSSKPAS